LSDDGERLDEEDSPFNIKTMTHVLHWWVGIGTDDCFSGLGVGEEPLILV